MIARKDEPIFRELWKNEFRMLPSTSDFIVNLVVGAIDGTHMEINLSTGDSKTDYFNRKQRYSIST